MHDNCFFVGARRILDWAMQAVVLTTAKLQKPWWVDIGQSSSKFSWSTYPEILMICGTKMPL